MSNKQNTLIRSVSRLILACDVVDGQLMIDLGRVELLPIIAQPGEGIIIRAEGMEVIIERSGE